MRTVRVCKGWILWNKLRMFFFHYETNLQTALFLFMGHMRAYNNKQNLPPFAISLVQTWDSDPRPRSWQYRMLVFTFGVTARGALYTCVTCLWSPDTCPCDVSCPEYCLWGISGVQSLEDDLWWPRTLVKCVLVKVLTFGWWPFTLVTPVVRDPEMF